MSRLPDRRPGFCTGELVALVSVMRPDLNCSATEVTGLEFCRCVRVQNIVYTGWVYRVAANNKRWCEPALRKLPPDPDQQFDKVMDRIKERVSADSVA